MHICITDIILQAPQINVMHAKIIYIPTDHMQKCKKHNIKQPNIVNPEIPAQHYKLK